jgi:hypothetical protein
VRLDLRNGSLWEPVADEQFDLIVTNPPFVISPATTERLLYRDSGMPGDELVRHVVTGAAQHLKPGGWCQLLGNWVHDATGSWEERLAGWLADTGCDTWVVQRERIDPARYIELWLDDAGLRGEPDYVKRYDAWAGWFEEQRITAVGMGWITLRNAGRQPPYTRIESWPYSVEQPIGPQIAAWATAVDHERALGDNELLATRLVTAADVAEERVGQPGAVDPDHIVLRSQRGMRRSHRASTAVAAMVGACDGELTLGQIAEALAVLLEADAARLRTELISAARTLLLDGLLTAPD